MIVEASLATQQFRHHLMPLFSGLSPSVFRLSLAVIMTRDADAMQTSMATASSRPASPQLAARRRHEQRA